MVATVAAEAEVAATVEAGTATATEASNMEVMEAVSGYGGRDGGMGHGLVD